MNLRPVSLAGSQVYVIIGAHREIYSFANDIFAFGQTKAENLCRLISEQVAAEQDVGSTRMSWYLRGSDHDAMLNLRDAGGKTIGLIRLLEVGGGEVELFHYDQGVQPPAGTVLERHGVTYGGKELIGKLRELALGLMTIPIT
jgi:hypothetical protein